MNNTINKFFWLLIYIGFAVDFFILSKPGMARIETCLFWIAIAIFNIWFELILRKK